MTFHTSSSPFGSWYPHHFRNQHDRASSRMKRSIHQMSTVETMSVSMVTETGCCTGGMDLTLARSVYFTPRKPLLLIAWTLDETLVTFFGISTTCTTQRDLAAHAVDGHGTRKSEEISQTQALAVLFLDGPQQGARLV